MSFKKQISVMAAAVALCYGNAWAAEAAAQPWMNARLDAGERADLVLKQMTMDEKLKLVYGYFGTDIESKKTKRPEGAHPQSAGFVYGVPRLGIPHLRETDAGLGVASQVGPEARAATALPSGLNTAATWDLKTAYEGGAMIGAEARGYGFNVLLAGGVNLMREPRNGRNFEYGGEDPLLAGKIVGAQIKGIQSQRVVSTLKHFALNDQETGRMTLNVKIDDQSARMSDLLALQIANEDGNPGSVMCSYNRVNGFYGCESEYLLTEVLKKDWGFKGWVMSDWGAVHSTIPAANAGLDQQSGMPFDLVTIPMPRRIEREGQRLPATYLNFLFVNGALLVPTFGDRGTERRVLDALQRLLPGRRVLGVPCRELIWGLGAIHCLSQQQPAG